MKRHHLIISGTGRAGTTFLIQLFTALGLDTGFRDPAADVFPNCDAGMEKDIREPDAPYVVKDPFLCLHLEEILERGDVVIDHAIIPVRDLHSAAESRRDVTRRADPAQFPFGEPPGGLWFTQEPREQEAILANLLYEMIYTLAKRDIPATLLHFPRFIHDPEYLFKKIGFALDGIVYEAFLKIFKQVARPELVHNFGNGGPQELPAVSPPRQRPRPASATARQEAQAEAIAELQAELRKISQESARRGAERDRAKAKLAVALKKEARLREKLATAPKSFAARWLPRWLRR